MQDGAIQPKDDSGEWRSVTTMFARHVRIYPAALAVTANGTAYSYAELAARVDQFAARLAARLGARVPGSEVLVGICLARDVDLPAWLLAIFKIGAAYMPIDPTTPPARVAHMVEDGRPAFIVASRCHADVVAWSGVPVMIAEDEIRAAPAPAVQVTPQSLAYVIFTSGSTGRPKGVEIEHGSLVALLERMASASPGLAAGERMLGITRLSFDLSVCDMFLPFYVGGSLALVEQDVVADPDRLAEAFDRYRPDLAQATPSIWRSLIESGWGGQANLCLVAGGEAVTRALADALLPCAREVWNIYGPTEATVWATACRIQVGTDAVPIGWPRYDCVHVAGADRAPVAPGEIGEIVIGGIGVGRGYRNRADLMAERFVVQADGARGYRTGDLGRFDADGALYCLGRLDDQVKLRGFRVELGDVEAALALHPAVAWGAVRLWCDPAGEPTLVAYVVPRQHGRASPREIKAFLATSLAPYMIPDRIVAMAAMPLTPNGKVDRAALANPFADVAPLSIKATDGSIKSRLGAIWRDILGVSEIADTDDFFDLGGYSLMTVRLTRRIDAMFGVKLAPIDVLQHSTLIAMSARIAAGNGQTPAEAMLLNDGGSRPPLFWLDAGPLVRTVMRALPSDQPAFALNIDHADEAAFESGALSIFAVAARLRMKLARYQPSGPYYLGGWCRWGIVAFELARQLSEQGETVALLVLLDAERPGHRAWDLRARLKSWRQRGIPAEDLPSFSQRVELAIRHYTALPYAGATHLLCSQDSIGDLGWGAVLTGDLRIARVPGDHMSIIRDTSARRLAEAVDDALALAQGNTKRLRNPADRSLSVGGIIQ